MLLKTPQKGHSDFMNQISTIKELIEQLNNANSNQFSEILNRVKIPAANFESYSTWCDEDYTRNCISRTDAYEMILLCWEKGIKTAIHDHGGQDCWVYQVKGKIEEALYKDVDPLSLKHPKKQQIGEGDITYMNDKMGYHSLENISDSRALTLHIYNSPIESCQVFSTKEECLNVVEMQYDTFEGEKVM